MDGSMFIGTWWALVPPLLAIVLAFITKEVYSSLFIGVAVGAMLYSGFNPWESFVNFFDIMKNSMNLNILIFVRRFRSLWKMGGNEDQVEKERPFGDDRSWYAYFCRRLF